MAWFKIENAPFERDLEVAVIDFDGTHSLVFPRRRELGGWTKAATGVPLKISPTHSSMLHVEAVSVDVTMGENNKRLLPI